MNSYPSILSIAGSDSVGGAGIQADIKTATALGVYAMTAVTAVTAQNTRGVRSWCRVEPRLLREQLEAVLDDVTPDAVKIGMIPDVDAVRVIADVLVGRRLQNIVLDPVCVATSGDALTTDSVPAEMSRLLFPLATVITPNIPEAEMFLSHEIKKDGLGKSASELCAAYNLNAVLLKGGHDEASSRSIDCLVERDRLAVFFDAERVKTSNTHGTGCTLSSAIASYMALGYGLSASVKKAKAWLHRAIAAGASYGLGHGHGPVNHLFETMNRNENQSKQ